ncbi:MAG: hypothetical protein ACJ8GN_26090 [Longimicrobiaceae bacterium]
MTQRRKTETAMAAAGEILLGETGAADDEALAGRSAVARRVASEQGISVRAAKKQVRDLLRVQLGKVPERAGRRVRKTWERTIGTLAEKSGLDSPEEAVRRIRVLLDRLRTRVLGGGMGGKSGTKDDRDWPDIEVRGTPTGSIPAGAAGYQGTRGPAYASAGGAEPAPAAGAAYTVELESGIRDYTMDPDPGTRGDSGVEADADGGLGGHSGTRDDR